MVKTLTVKYQLPTSNEHVAVTDDLSAVLDPATFSRPQPPPVLPVTTVSWAQVVAAVPPAEDRQDELAVRTPAAWNRSADGLAIARRVLELGQRLGVVNLTA